MSKKSIIFVAHAAFTAGILLFGCGSQSGTYENARTEGNNQAVKIKAPDFSLVDLKGKSFSLGDYKGKVVLLDFWATWCPPCVWSSPKVDELAAEYKGKKFQVISISLDMSPDSVARFFDGKEVIPRVALAGGSPVSNQYRISGIPAFFLIDQDGYLVRKWGGFSETLPLLWRKEIDRLLNSRKP